MSKIQKMADPAHHIGEEQKSQEPTKEEEILELAKKELMREIKCASMRAEQFGAHSWAKPQNYVPSKRFLRQMLMCTSRSNERKESKEKDRYDMKHRENQIGKKTSSVKHLSKKSHPYHMRTDRSDKEKSKHSRELSPSKHKSKHRESKYSERKHYKH